MKLTGLRLIFEQGAGEGFGVERLEVVGLFSEADEFDGEAEFFLNTNDGAAFASAIEFSHDEAVEADGLVELPGLGERIETG